MIRYSDLPTGMLPRWEPTCEGRFDHEIRDLLYFVGDTLRIDEQLLQKGTLRLEFSWPSPNGSTRSLQAIFPDSYPFIRPQVSLIGEQSSFPSRHSSPDGTLCLLGRDSGLWSAEWTLATLIEKQLTSVFDGSANEDPQGEPIEVWWNYAALSLKNLIKGSYLLIDSSWNLQHAASGIAKIRYALHYEKDEIRFRGVVENVCDDSGNVLAMREFQIPDDLARSQTIHDFPWRRSHGVQPPLRATASDPKFWRSLTFNDCTISTHGRAINLSLTVQSTEIALGRLGDSWLPVLQHGPAKYFRPAKPGRPQHSPDIVVVPTYRAGLDDIGGRVPSVNILRDKTLALFGLGAIGAPIAMELARNGCRKIIVLDHDVVEPGNSIRWPLGTSAWGRQKVLTIKEHIEREYPGAHVEAVNHYVGSASIVDGGGDGDVIPGIISNADLVIDASASTGVSRLLADYCQRANKFMISAYGTASLKGGVVALYSPTSGCPTCREFAYEKGLFLKPPGSGETNALKQPPGCAELTFTGASFDLQELSLAAVRLAVDVLKRPNAHRESMIQTLAFDDSHNFILPKWRADVLPAMPECGCQKR